MSGTESDASQVSESTFCTNGPFNIALGSLTAAVVVNPFAVPFYATTEMTSATPAYSRDALPLRTFSKALEGHIG